MKIFYNIHIPHTHLQKYRPKTARNEIEREKIVRKNMCVMLSGRVLTLAHTMHGKRSKARGVAKDGKVLGSIGGKMKIHNQKKRKRKRQQQQDGE